jgi:hypothetical protein
MLPTPYQISRISEKPFSRYPTVAILCSDPVLLNERILMAITREKDFVSRAAGEWRNSSERIIASNTLIKFKLKTLKINSTITKLRKFYLLPRQQSASFLWMFIAGVRFPLEIIDKIWNSSFYYEYMNKTFHILFVAFVDLWCKINKIINLHNLHN